MIRVLHVVDSLAPGGLENGIVNVARQLQGREFDIHVACLRFRGDFASRMPNPEQVLVLGKQDGFSPRAVWRLVRLVGALRPDVIHTHNLGTLIYAALATCGGLLCPIAHGEHGQIQKQDLTAKRLAQRRRLFRCCRRVHVVSSSVRDNLVGLGLCKKEGVVVTPNGVDAERFAPPESKAAARAALDLPGDAQVVGIVGRLVALKRHRMLFDAFAQLASRHHRLWLLVAGDGGADRDELIQSMRSHPNADRLRWLGHQDDLRPCYQSLDLLAAPSEIEGLSNAVLEAMACGVPVLAHSACGNAEVIEDGISGHLADLRNHEDLARKIEVILASPELLQQTGHAARSTVLERFSMTAMADAYRRLYREASGRVSQ